MSEASPKAAHIQLGSQLEQFMAWVFSFIAPLSPSGWLRRMSVVSYAVTQENFDQKTLLITRIPHSTLQHERAEIEMIKDTL